MVQQKVYVRGGEKEEEPLEMIVYNQGMFKTELCNKWSRLRAINLIYKYVTSNINNL